MLSLRTRFIPEERRKRILELEERISPGCGLCWVVMGCDCSHEDFKLEYKRFRF